MDRPWEMDMTNYVARQATPPGLYGRPDYGSYPAAPPGLGRDLLFLFYVYSLGANGLFQLRLLVWERLLE